MKRKKLCASGKGDLRRDAARAESVQPQVQSTKYGDFLSRVHARLGRDVEGPRSAVSTSPTFLGALRVGGDVRAPVLLRRVDPPIPDEARKARISGIVILQMLVDKEGSVVDAKVLKPLPLGVVESVLAAVRQWSFAPGTYAGKPVDVTFNVTLKIDAE